MISLPHSLFLSPSFPLLSFPFTPQSLSLVPLNSSPILTASSHLHVHPSSSPTFLSASHFLYYSSQLNRGWKIYLSTETHEKKPQTLWRIYGIDPWQTLDTVQWLKQVLYMKCQLWFICSNLWETWGIRTLPIKTWEYDIYMGHPTLPHSPNDTHSISKLDITIDWTEQKVHNY